MIRRHAGSPTKLLVGAERRPGRRRRHGLALDGLPQQRVAGSRGEGGVVVIM